MFSIALRQLFNKNAVVTARMTHSLKGKVALVTGASRGLGKGIAIELGAANATVYITGRKPSESESKKAHTSTLQEVADEIKKRGGTPVIAYCDHSKPADIKALFNEIDRKENGQLDILVNNAFAGVFHMVKNLGKKFYEYDESPEDAYDIVNNVGLRNNYICSVYAAQMMAKRKLGVIINISSIGAVNYLFNVPYGFGKEALVRMSSDMAIELAEKNVFSLALLPGAVQTEIVQDTVLKGPDGPGKSYFEDGESIYYVGKIIAHLAKRPELLKKYNGKAVTTTSIGDEFKILDIDGKMHRDKRIDNYTGFLKQLNDVHLEFLPK